MFEPWDPHWDDAVCHILYPLSTAHTGILRMDSNSTSYGRQLALTDAITALKKELKMLDEKFDEAVVAFKENQSSGTGAY